jgi:hypothetical protein
VFPLLFSIPIPIPAPPRVTLHNTLFPLEETHRHIHTYIHSHAHTLTYTHTYTHTLTHTHLHIHLHTHTHTYIHTYTHTTHTRTHTHTHHKSAQTRPSRVVPQQSVHTYIQFNPAFTTICRDQVISHLWKGSIRPRAHADTPTDSRARIGCD